MADLSSELDRAQEDPKGVAKTVFTRFREDDVPFMAASVAYHAFASLVPILVLLFLFVTVVGDEQFARQVVALTEGVLPNSAQEPLSNAISSEGGMGGTGASIIGFVTLLWGALKIFRGMDKAFSDIYRTEDENTFVDQLKDGVVVLVALVVGVVGMVGAMSVFAAFGGPLSQVLSLVALVVGLTLAFLPMYKFFPDAELGWTDALPGAALAAGGWMLLQYLFQLYVGVSGSGGSSGAIGAVLLLLLWLYLSALVLLLAAVVNAVLLGEFKDDVGASAESDGDGDDETTALRGRLHRQRDRRQSLEHELTRLERRLERESRDPSEELKTLRARNRTLRRWVEWKRRSLYRRLLARALGERPPELERPSRRPPIADGVNDPVPADD